MKFIKQINGVTNADIYDVPAADAVKHVEARKGSYLCEILNVEDLSKICIDFDCTMEYEEGAFDNVADKDSFERKCIAAVTCMFPEVVQDPSLMQIATRHRVVKSGPHAGKLKLSLRVFLKIKIYFGAHEEVFQIRRMDQLPADVQKWLDMKIYNNSRKMNCVYMTKDVEQGCPPLMPQSGFTAKYGQQLDLSTDTQGYLLQYTDDCIELQDLKDIKKAPRVKKAPVTKSPKPSVTSNELPHKLLALLADHRADRRDEWVNVGALCYSVFEDEEEGREAFHKFSSRCPEKYDEADTDRVWDSLREKKMTMGTLHYWAKMDDPEGYQKVLQEDVTELINTAISSKGAHLDVALVFVKMFKGLCYYVEATDTLHYCDPVTRIWKTSKKCGYVIELLSSNIAKVFYKHATALKVKASEAETEADCKAYEELSKACTDIYNRLKNTGYCKSVAEMACIYIRHEDFHELLDSNNHLFAFTNCVVDWQTREVRPILPSDYISTTTGYALPEAINYDECRKEWFDFLATIYRRRDVQDYVTNLVTDSMDGRIPKGNHKIITHTGVGRNGKSVMMTTLCPKLFGEYYYKANISLLCDKRKEAGAANEAVFKMRGKRMIVMTEPSDDEKLNTGFAKELAGGEPMAVRGLYGRQGHIDTAFYMHILCNNNLNLDGSDTALAERLKVVRYENRFLFGVPPSPENGVYAADPEMVNRFVEKAPLFARFLIEHRLKFKGTTVEPEQVVSWSKYYSEKCNVVLRFVRETLRKVTPSASLRRAECVTLMELKQTFKVWGQGDNDAYKMKPGKIAEELQKLLGEPVEAKKVDGKTYRSVYVGWTFVTDSDEQDELN